MPPALDIGGAVGAVAVADGHIDNLEVKARGSEKEIKVAEGIKVTEVGPVCRDPFIVGAPQDLGAAERVLERLPQDPGEQDAKGLVGAHVHEAHRRLLHGVHEA